MEEVTGVDVSWLHHSKESPAQQKALLIASEAACNNVPLHGDAPTTLPPKHTPKVASPSITTNGVSNGNTGSHGQHRQHLHLPIRHSDLKDAALMASPLKNPKEQSSTPPLIRKGSWISSLKSQFSSSSQQGMSAPFSPVAKPSPTTTNTEAPNGTSANISIQKDGKRSEAPPQPPPSPKSSAPSFLQSALRRLSSSGGGMGKMSCSGGICPRKVMNVDPYRERCLIEELQPCKLRRVSFCVDVEIAGHATCFNDEDEGTPPPPGRRPSLSELERHTANKKARDQSLKTKEKTEGEALKRTDAVAETEETSEDPEPAEEKVEQTPGPATATATDPEQPQTSRKKEKRKKSEEERKQRKEKRHLQALANGSIPLEITKESSSESSLPSAISPVPQRDRPTTDPLRIYKRCCQLRETQVLKRITEQLTSPSACDPLSYGTVQCLDFTGSRMQLPDVVTLGDYLAVVPVKKLILEDCDLTDEALRVILAGLLAAKNPDQAKFNRELARGSLENLDERVERLGIIEKISLKNNPQIGRDGWRHIALFIHMSRSLKAIDLSMIQFPTKSEPVTPPNHHHAHAHKKSGAPVTAPVDPGLTFGRCLMKRLASSRLEELVMAECGLDTDLVKKFVRGVKASGVTRLGLAGNNLDAGGMEAIASLLRDGKLEGLDLGGNVLSRDLLDILVRSLNSRDNPLYALSLADCSLTPDSLRDLLPALAQLPNFRFVDLSHNRRLFSTQPNATGLLRKYLPRMATLKRIHLNNVAMEPEHCIALAEVLPEIPTLGHISILENQHLSALASAKGEASREEACALYASLMAAARVSDSIISIDIDVPTSEAGEIVQALAKQVVAYCLRNMERGPIAELAAAETQMQEHTVALPEVLLHLVGHSDAPGEVDEAEAAPDDDYIVGGTGVVKALSVCLGNKTVSEHRRISGQNTPGASVSGTATPNRDVKSADIKSKAMSKNLLGSARKIRARIQPAIAREEQVGDEMAYKRLKFLDSTLERIIQRFEDEYPECRLSIQKSAPSSLNIERSLLSTSPDSGEEGPASSTFSFTNPVSVSEDALDGLNDTTRPIRPSSRTMSRHDSDVSIASRYLAQEEGRMLRFGQQVRRDLLRSQMEDHHHGTTGTEVEQSHIQDLRRKLETLSGSEIRDRIESIGYEAAATELRADAEKMKMPREEDPQAFELLMEAQNNADGSVKVGVEGMKEGREDLKAQDQR